MWYEIAEFPGYRINHRRQVMSLKGEGPQVMKTFVAGGVERVLLRQEGRYVNCRVDDLLVSAGLQVRTSRRPNRRTHCAQGHEFTPANTMHRISRGREVRKCKRCHAMAMARYRRKLTAAAQPRATAPDCKESKSP